MGLQPNGIQTIKVCAVFLGFTTALVIARAVTRFKIHKPLATADYLMFAAYVCFVAYCAAVMAVIVNDGGTVNIFALPPQTVETVFKTMTITELIYLTELTFVKMSVLFFYYEIFAVPRLRRLILGVMAVCMAWFLIMIFVTAFQCRDPSDTYSLAEYTQQQNRCLDYPRLVFGTELSNAVIDVIILATPFPGLVKLQMKTAKKVAVAVILLLGSGVVVTSVCRIVFVYSPSGHTTLDWPRSTDWSTVQLGSAIICGCLPTLAPLLPDKWRTRVTDRTESKGRGSGRSSKIALRRGQTDASGLIRALNQPSSELEKSYSEAYCSGDASESGQHDDDIPLNRIAIHTSCNVRAEFTK